MTTHVPTKSRTEVLTELLAEALETAAELHEGLDTRSRNPATTDRTYYAAPEPSRVAHSEIEPPQYVAD